MIACAFYYEKCSSFREFSPLAALSCISETGPGTQPTKEVSYKLVPRSEEKNSAGAYAVLAVCFLVTQYPRCEKRICFLLHGTSR